MINVKILTPNTANQSSNTKDHTSWLEIFSQGCSDDLVFKLINIQHSNKVKDKENHMITLTDMLKKLSQNLVSIHDTWSWYRGAWRLQISSFPALLKGYWFGGYEIHDINLGDHVSLPFPHGLLQGFRGDLMCARTVEIFFKLSTVKVVTWAFISLIL